MEKTFIRIVAIILLSACAMKSNAIIDQGIDIINIADGLPSNSVAAITSDSDGFVWLATHGGISRYDGNRMTNYRCDGHISEISSIAVAGTSDYLAFIDNKRLRWLNRKNGRIYSTDTVTGISQVRWIFPVDDRHLGIVATKRVMIIDTGSLGTVGQGLRFNMRCLKDFTSEQCVPLAATSGPNGLTAIFDSQNRIRLLSPDGKSIRTVTIAEGSSLSVNDILMDGERLLIGTIREGLYSVWLSSGKVTNIIYNPADADGSLSHTDVYGIARIGNGEYLATTWNGYTMLRADKSDPGLLHTEVFNITTRPSMRNLESHMLSAHLDFNNNIWIGTDGGGAICANLDNQFFKKYFQNSHNEITSILEDKQGYIYMTTFHKGILRSTMPADGIHDLEFEPLRPDSGPGYFAALCSLADTDGNLWFGSSDGVLLKLDASRQHWNRIHIPEVGWIRALALAPDGTILIGGKSFARLTPGCSEATCFPLAGQDGKRLGDMTIRHIFVDNNGSIWLATSSYGLLKIAPDGSMLTGLGRCSGFSHGDARVIHCSGDTTLWVGFLDGLAEISISDNSLLRFVTPDDGLCGYSVRALAEDLSGNLWIGSNAGISVKRPKGGITNFYITGSISAAMASNKMLYFGNNISLTYFNHEKALKAEKPPRVMITSLEIHNTRVTPGVPVNGEVILDSVGIEYASDIHLDYDNRDFAIEFHTIGQQPDRPILEYRLYPLQKEWVSNQSNDKVSYSNLLPGEYRFEIRSLATGVHPAMPIKSLCITIRPPWYMTWWFGLLVAIVIMSATIYAVILIRRRNRRIIDEMRLKNELARADMEKENEKRLRIELENFFTKIAHELRTPLTLILAPLHDLSNDKTLTDTSRRLLGLIRRSADDLNWLTEQLLYMQKLKLGMAKPVFCRFNLTEVLADCAERFRSTASSLGLSLKIDLPSHPVYVTADREKIISAVYNLLSNAIKYTPAPGQVRLSMTDCTADRHSQLRIMVADNGPGIPDDKKKSIFDPFDTGDNNPAVSSRMGVGLWVVQSIMKLHGGTVSVTDSPEGGSLFILEFPHNEPTSVVEGMAESDNRQPSILIVDDNSDVREYLRTLFGNGYSVIEAESGDTCFDMAKKSHPDVIIMDVMMPGEDGMTCCTRIKADPELAMIPVILLTAKGEEEDVIKGIRAGADDYISKPFNPSILSAKVKNLIHLRTQLRRIYSGKKEAEARMKEGVKTDNGFVEKVCECVRANLSEEDFNVRRLAEAMNMSYSAFYRKLSESTDMSAAEIITNTRMIEAARLVMENDMSLQQIAYKLGYSDIRTFRKHFKNCFGVLPSHYRDV